MPLSAALPWSSAGFWPFPKFRFHGGTHYGEQSIHPIGNAANCLYPNEVKITDDFSAKLAFATDMVCARYKNNYRNTANFEVANALPGDCDNDHSEIAADWVTPEDIADLFADVPYVADDT